MNTNEMTLDELAARLPKPAKDLRLNLRNLLSGGTSLNGSQLWGSALASALATGDRDLIGALARAAGEELSETELDAVRSAAALMAMNNVYYRSLHLLSDGSYTAMPARLRMQALASHGADPLDFELWCLAVSAVNGCGRCLDAHEGTLRKKGVAPEAILDALRVASVVHAVGATLQGEAALAAARN